MFPTPSSSNRPSGELWLVRHPVWAIIGLLGVASVALVWNVTSTIRRLESTIAVEQAASLSIGRRTVSSTPQSSICACPKWMDWPWPSAFELLEGQAPGAGGRAPRGGGRRSQPEEAGVRPPTGLFRDPFVTQFVTGKRNTAPRLSVRDAVSRCGGSAWESNPPEPPKAPPAVLKVILSPGGLTLLPHFEKAVRESLGVTDMVDACNTRVFRSIYTMRVPCAPARQVRQMK